MLNISDYIKKFYAKYLAWHYKGRINRTSFFLFSFAMSVWSEILISLLTYKNISFFLWLMLWLMIWLILYSYGGLIVRRVRDIGWSNYISVIFIILGLLFGLFNQYIAAGILFLILTLFPSKKSS